MQEIKPYQTLSGLKKALDNGGRFYNLFSKVDDSVVSKGELARAAGVFTAGQAAFLFLDMAQHDLAEADRSAVNELLDADLRKQFAKGRPKTVAPSAIESEGKAGAAVITTGYAQYIDDRSEFNGFIHVPIMVGKVMTFILVPLFDHNELYKLYDDKKCKGAHTIIAVPKSKKNLNLNGPIRFGGLLKKVVYDADSTIAQSNFVEALYYTKLPAAT